MTERRSSRDHFLPFNLCKVVPFEATAAALRALPTVQPRAPTSVPLLPEIPVSLGPVSDDVTGSVLDMLAETARDWYVFVPAKFVSCVFSHDGV
jgi:hypothetical protein